MEVYVLDRQIVNWVADREAIEVADTDLNTILEVEPRATVLIRTVEGKVTDWPLDRTFIDEV